MAVLLNGLLALKAVASRLPKEAFSVQQEDVSSQLKGVSQQADFNQVERQDQSTPLDQGCDSQLDHLCQGHKQTRKPELKMACNSNCNRRVDHRATTVGTSSERSTGEDYIIEDGQLGKRFPLNQTTTTGKNPRKFSLDMANIENKSLERPMFFDDNLLTPDNSKVRKQRTAFTTESMQLEEVVETSADRLSQLSFDNNHRSHEKMVNGQDPLVGQGRFLPAQQENGQDHQELRLSRTTSGLSSCTIQINEKNEIKPNRFKQSEQVDQRESTIYEHGNLPNLCKNNGTTSMSDDKVNCEGNTFCDEGCRSSCQSILEKNSALDSLLDSLERSGEVSRRLDSIAEELKMFRLPVVNSHDHGKRLEEAASRYAEIHQGKLVPMKVRFMDTFTFKCCLGHKFELKTHQIASSVWCDKCSELWTLLQKQSKKRDSVIMDSMISPQVNIRCMRNHLFTIKPSE